MTSSIHSSILPFSTPPCPHREEECEDGVEEEEEETPVTESDSDEQEGALTESNQSTPRYFRTRCRCGIEIMSCALSELSKDLLCFPSRLV